MFLGRFFRAYESPERYPDGNEIGFNVSYKVLGAAGFGVPVPACVSLRHP